MKVTIQYVVTMELNAKEANWLKLVMQNPLHGESVDGEHWENADMRKKFFEALDNKP